MSASARVEATLPHAQFPPHAIRHVLAVIASRATDLAARSDVDLRGMTPATAGQLFQMYAQLGVAHDTVRLYGVLTSPAAGAGGGGGGSA